MIKLYYALALIVLLTALYLVMTSLGGCSYKAHYNPETNTLIANTKGKYKYQDEKETFEADFRNPIVNIAPKLDYESD